MSILNHPLKSLFEDEIAEYGINAEDVRTADENQLKYTFSTEGGTTVVLKLYRHQDEGDIARSWICLELGVGLVDVARASEVLKRVAFEMHSCFVPLRAFVGPFDDHYEMLVFMCRVESDALSVCYFPYLLSAGIGIADEIRERENFLSVV